MEERVQSKCPTTARLVNTERATQQRVTGGICLTHASIPTGIAIPNKRRGQECLGNVTNITLFPLPNGHGHFDSRLGLSFGVFPRHVAVLLDRNFSNLFLVSASVVSTRNIHQLLTRQSGLQASTIPSQAFNSSCLPLLLLTTILVLISMQCNCGGPKREIPCRHSIDLPVPDTHLRHADQIPPVYAQATIAPASRAALVALSPLRPRLH